MEASLPFFTDLLFFTDVETLRGVGDFFSGFYKLFYILENTRFLFIVIQQKHQWCKAEQNYEHGTVKNTDKKQYIKKRAL